MSDAIRTFRERYHKDEAEVERPDPYDEVHMRIGRLREKIRRARDWLDDVKRKVALRRPRPDNADDEVRASEAAATFRARYDGLSDNPYAGSDAISAFRHRYSGPSKTRTPLSEAARVFRAKYREQEPWGDRALGKLTKEDPSVNYRYAKDPAVSCGACVHYREPGACEIVAGAIRPVDVCDRFEPKDGAMKDDDRMDDTKHAHQPGMATEAFRRAYNRRKSP